jgi:uncharacterized protein YutE (UPF0331/DUF86 family)
VVRADLVKRKLNLIAEDLQGLVPFRALSFEEVTGDIVKLAAVERMVERIVMRAIDVNEHVISELATGEEERTCRLTYKDTFLKMGLLGVFPPKFAERIAKSASLRNILVHDYNDVDRKILLSSVKSCVRDYRKYCEHLLAFLKTLV